MASKADYYRQMLGDDEPSLTETNRAKADAAGRAGNARRAAAYQASPVGAFQGRMRSQGAAPEVWSSDARPESDAAGFQRELVQGAGEVNDQALAPRGSAPADIGMPTVGGTTHFSNPRAGVVSILGDEPMTATQRDTVVQSARAQTPQKAPLRGSINGQSFEMPASGPRVSATKAQSYLALAAQEKAAADAKAIADRDYMAKRVDHQAELDRQNRIDETADFDRNTARKEKYETGLQQRELNDYTINRQKQLDTRNDAEYVSPKQTAALSAMQKMLENPQLSPTTKAALQARIAAQSGVDMPMGVQEDLAKPAPGQNADAAMAVANSPLVAPIIQRAIQEAKNVHAGRAANDLANNESIFGSALATPYRLAFGGRGLTNKSTGGLEQIFSQALQAAKQQNPQADEGTLRQVIANQIMAEVPGDNTQAAAEIARVLGVGPAAMQRPASLVPPAANPSPGVQLARRRPEGEPAF